jgi:hypothetical protein
MAASKFLSGIDLAKNELQNPRFHQLASAPGSPVEGQVYHNTTDHHLYEWNGTAWIQLDNSGGSTGHLIKDDGTAKTARGSLNFIDTTSIAFTATDNSGADSTEITAAPLYGAATSETTFGASSANGSAATVARSDHGHGNPTHNTAAHSAVSISGLAAPTADVPWGSFKITGLATPTAGTDAATKAYVDAAAAGIDWKASVRAATTATGTLASSFANGSVIDGITLATNDRILIKDQSTGSENGIYTVNAAGAPTRATDADANAEVTSGMAVFVEVGTANADTGWVLTTDGAITVGTTALVFTQFTSLGQVGAGTGLTKTGAVINVIGGVGILANADDVAIDTAVVVRKFAANIGDGSTTSIAVTHSLGTKDVTWSCRQVSDDVFVYVDAVATSTSVLTLVFAVAPTTNQYRVIVHA